MFSTICISSQHATFKASIDGVMVESKLFSSGIDMNVSDQRQERAFYCLKNAGLKSD